MYSSGSGGETGEDEWKLNGTGIFERTGRKISKRVGKSADCTIKSIFLV